MENETEISKNSLDQNFTGENKTKQTSRIFDLFRGLRVFLSWSMSQFFHTYLTKNLRSCTWLVYLKFLLGYGYPHPLFA